MYLRTTPKFNYYMTGPRSFGPYSFAVVDDERAEVEFRAWLKGEENGTMSFGPRPEGTYMLWRQPLTLDLHTRNLAKFRRKLHERDEDELVACEGLPLVYGVRPQIDYSEYRFVGHIRNWHEEMAARPKATEDVFVITAYRADRVIVFCVYGEPCEDDPEPWWSAVFNTTVPTYAPHSDGVMADLDVLLSLDFEPYSTVVH